MEQLRIWRKDQGLSTDDAGKLVGVSGIQWHRYEAGTRRVSERVLPAIARVTGIPVHKLRPDLASIFGAAPTTRSKPSQQERAAQ